MSSLKRIVKLALGVSLCCLYGLIMFQIAEPETMAQVKERVMSMLSIGADGLYEIEDDMIPLGSALNENGKQSNGRLQVQKGQLVNEEGEVFQLRGMSSHGLAWFPQYTSKASIETTRHYGANLFRIAMYADDDAGNYTAILSDQEKNKTALYAAIDHTLALDMYAIVDWHTLKDGNPLNRMDMAVAFFDELSRKYADEPGILYEICNEPNGNDVTWHMIYQYACAVIPVIRQNASDAIIIVGTPHYSSDIASAMKYPLPYENIMYAYHYYSGNSRDDYKHTLNPAIKAGFPVFISEWGLGSEAAPDVLEEQYAKDFLAYMDKNHMSWANWSLCNKDESFSAILPHVSKVSGWTEADLTPSGKIVFGALQNGK